MRSPNARMQRLMRICIRDFRFANGFTQEEMAEQLRLLPSDERNAILTHFRKKDGGTANSSNHQVVS